MIVWNLDTKSRRLTLLPVEDLLHIRLQYLEVVTVPHGGLQQDPDGEGQLGIALAKCSEVVESM